jgi:DNA polymerase-3 subunit gamma/tau
MKLQAMSFGMSELTHASNAVSAALSEMSGATSPKLQLELMCAKVLVPSSDRTEVGSLARIERLERRMGVAQSADAAPVQAAPVKTAPVQAPSAPAQPVAPVAAKPAAAAPSKPAAPTAPSTNGVSTQAMIAAWPEILSQVKAESKSAWVVAFTLTVMDLSADVLTLKFLSQKDLDGFKADSRSTDALRKAIFAVLGLQVKFKPHVEESIAEVSSEAATEAHPPTTAIPVVKDEPVAKTEAKEEKPAAPESKSRNGMVDEDARYGESLLREMLGAEPMQDPKAGGR